MEVIEYEKTKNKTRTTLTPENKKGAMENRLFHY